MRAPPNPARTATPPVDPAVDTAGSAPRPIALIVNDRRRAFSGPAFRRLIDVLREDFGLTGTKEGCGEGECGACTVLVDDVPVNSCLIPICQVEGRSIRTVESLGQPEALNALQQAFLASGGAQCGICTPGMLMTATAWIEGGGSADPAAIRAALAGNLCRCTGYQHIVDAVAAAVRARPRSRRRPRPRSPGAETPATPATSTTGEATEARRTAAAKAARRPPRDFSQQAARKTRPTIKGGRG